MSNFSMSETSIKGCFVLESKVYDDNRGFFREWFKEFGGFDFPIKQANLSISNQYVLRGMHYSIGATSQAKVVTCVSGEFQDVLLDIRSDSPTFGEVFSLSSSFDAGKSIYVAPGVAHGFLTLRPSTGVVYLTSEPYDPSSERSINALDPIFNGIWVETMVTRSPKDEIAPFLDEI